VKSSSLRKDRRLLALDDRRRGCGLRNHQIHRREASGAAKDLQTARRFDESIPIRAAWAGVVYAAMFPSKSPP